MNNKLAELFTSFSKKELKELEEFLHSPYFNKSPKVLSLFYQIKKQYPKIGISGMSKEDIFGSLYPGEKFNPLKLELIISALVKLIEKFLKIKYVLEDKESSDLILLKTFRSKDLHKNFSSTAKRYLNTLKNKAAQNTNDYLLISQVENEIINSDVYDVFLSKNLRFQKVIDNLDYYIAASKLSQASFILEHKNEVGDDLKYNLWLLNETLDFVRSKIAIIENEHPLLYCYYMIALMLIEPENENNFFVLKKYIIKYDSVINEAFLWEVLIGMENYCDNRIKNNREKYINESFEIYKILEAKNFFKKQIYINHIDFLNVVTVGLALKKQQWVDEFAANYKNKLPLEFKNDTISLAKAELLFSKGQFESSLASLSKVKYENYYFYLRIKILQAKIFYETGENELLFCTLDALRHYLSRNKKLLIRYEKVTLNFIHYLNFIIVNDKLNEDQLLLMKDKISKETQLTSKEWLLAKYDELIAKISSKLHSFKLCSKVP
jgi:hypothetical protein